MIPIIFPELRFTCCMKSALTAGLTLALVTMFAVSPHAHAAGEGPSRTWYGAGPPPPSSNKKCMVVDARATADTRSKSVAVWGTVTRKSMLTQAQTLWNLQCRYRYRASTEGRQG